jgi:hypothetical protein
MSSEETLFYVEGEPYVFKHKEYQLTLTVIPLAICDALLTELAEEDVLQGIAAAYRFDHQTNEYDCTMLGGQIDFDLMRVIEETDLAYDIRGTSNQLTFKSMVPPDTLLIDFM